MVTNFSIANLYNANRELWINVQLADIFDILIVSFSIYLGIILLKRARSLYLFNGLLVFVAVYLVARIFSLYLTSLLFQFFFAFFFIIMAIILQKEIRTFFEMISAPEKFKKILGIKTKSVTETTMEMLIKTAGYLSLNKIGALMVLPGSQPIEGIVEGGTELGGKISLSLLLSIFDASSPGHDGAIIIEKDNIKKFGAHLPLAERFMKFGDLGTRHRAALGMATASDALTIVISEEKGTISVAQNGDLKTLSGTSELRDLLKDFLKGKQSYTAKKFWKDFLIMHIPEKILALSLACVLWFVLAFQPEVTARSFDVPLEFRSLPKNITVSQIEPGTVKVTLSGRIQEFNLFNNDSLKITIDASDFSAGDNRVQIEGKNITYPSSLSVTDFSPGEVVVKTKSKETSAPPSGLESISETPQVSTD